MDNNYMYKFKTRHVSIVQPSPSVVNAFTSSVELIPAITYKLKCDTIQNLKCDTLNKTKRHWIERTHAERCWLVSTHVCEHLSRDRNSHTCIHQYLQQSQTCWGLANKNSFSIVNCAAGAGLSSVHLTKGELTVST